MPKALQNQYPDQTSHLTNDQIRQALTGDFDGFKYFFENCMLLQDRDTRQYVHPKMNKGQEMIARTILGYVDKKTRENTHKECVICGPRQFGKSTSITAIANYIEAYVPAMENLNLVNTMHTSDAATKYFKQKLEPILTNVHPDIFPTIERDSSVSSTLLQYKDIKGIPRGGYYEILSAGSNSVRSGTVSIWLCDEPSEYRNPEVVEDAVSGAISSYGFSFTAYIGTFSDRLSSYFLDKIKTAIENPDEMELVFIPWFLVYGREEDGKNVNLAELKDYEQKVIVPEMIKWNIPTSEWAGKIGWYRTRSLRTSKMRYEFPSSIDDILDLTSDKKVFSQESINTQKANILAGQKMRILTDRLASKPVMDPTDASPLTVFKEPAYGHNYKLVVDPITAVNDNTDYFAMCVFDEQSLEQVAVFYGNDMPLEDYADYAVSIAKIYNNAIICPESNVAAAFVTSVYALRYYNLYYETPLARKNRIPGIRTTATSKEQMIDNLKLLLDNNRIILHDEETISELETFEKKIKTRTDGSQSVKMAARKGKKDDLVACFSGETMVKTSKGDKKIKDIKIGEYVLTSKGFRRVLGVSSRVADVECKFGMKATPDHIFITPNGNQEWTNIDIHSKIYVCPKNIEKELLSNTKVKNITDIQMPKDALIECTIGDILRKNHTHCTDKSTKTILGRFRKDIVSTIKMVIPTTILRIIYRLCRTRNICRSKAAEDGPMKSTERNEQRNSQLLNQKRNALKHRKIEKRYCTSAKCVERNSTQSVTPKSRDGAMNVKNTCIQTKMGSISKEDGKLKNSEESLENMGKAYQEETIVYNLLVEDAHNFFANGILVHNCLWIFVGSLTHAQLAGNKKRTLSVL